MKEDKVKKCVEENRDKGEIKKTKGKKMWLRKKQKKKKEGVVLVLVIRVVWGKGINKFFFFFK